jgi:hypothetical protein
VHHCGLIERTTYEENFLFSHWSFLTKPHRAPPEFYFDNMVRELFAFGLEGRLDCKYSEIDAACAFPFPKLSSPDEIP